MRSDHASPRLCPGTPAMTRISPALRRRVRQRARGLCEYCRSSAELTGHSFTIDHIVPGSRGGGNRFDNLCWCCFWCNAFKQARTEARDSHSGVMVSLFNPRLANWQDHFRWSRDANHWANARRPRYGCGAAPKSGHFDQGAAHLGPVRYSSARVDWRKPPPLVISATPIAH
jgi:5-methylcytosine-specific restriction endonuclease McrA